jgi:hypothetical protein
MEPEAIPEEVKRIFMRLCDLNATVEDMLKLCAFLIGKVLATYAADPETARTWLEMHNGIAMQARELLADSYRREGHPLDARRPN